ncbi:MAG TPA: histidine phosphatase family protein [Actinomycetes bacterium]|nr:histidine phosphatase family protein [Actinomycetes bacterium]
MVLWRHGRTTWNDEQRFQGHSDVGLNDVGRVQAQLAAQQLMQLRPHLIVSSDLSRAADTGDELARLVGLEVTTDPALRETNGGRWEGKQFSELVDDPDYLAWRSGGDVAAGGAETRSQVAERAITAVEAATGDLEDGGLVVVVTHGGTIRCVLGGLLGLPIPHWRIFGGLANCCWSVLEEGRSGWRLTEHNAGSLPEAVLGDDR